MKNALSRFSLERQFDLMRSAPSGTVIIATFIANEKYYISYTISLVGPDFLIVQKGAESDLVHIDDINGHISHNYVPAQPPILPVEEPALVVA